MDVSSETMWIAVCAMALVTLLVVMALIRPRKALSPKEYRQFTLIGKTRLTHNTRRFDFGLPSSAATLGLPIGNHISLRATAPNGQIMLRPYTPTTRSSTTGHFSLVVKVYPKGLMTQYLDALQIGDAIDVCGPRGKLAYTGRGRYTLTKRRVQSEHKAARIAMVAGGTGITPMLQLIQAIVDDPLDNTELRLVFANVSEDDILLREELESLQEQHAQFKLFLTLDRAPPGWKQGEGYVTEAMMAEHLFSPAPDTLLCMCGPKPMTDGIAKHAASLGHASGNIFSF